MLTKFVAGRVFDWSHSIGRWGGLGTAMTCPISPALSDQTLYVICRGQELIPVVTWDKTGNAVKISKISLGDGPGDEEFEGELGKYGINDGEFIWPTGLAIDSQRNLWVTDEWQKKVIILDPNGKYIRSWGTSDIPGLDFGRPSGIAIDSDDNVYIVDSACHKVQKFDKECNPLLQWGEFGTSHGQFDSPWGITIDKAGDVYIADHKNHRVEKFSPQGDFISSFGHFGNGRGELNRPTDVAVDPDGDVYICDWLNNRVQMFDKAGTFLTSFIGDAQVLSKWAVPVVVSNPDAVKRRREVGTLETEWRFCMPTGVTFDSKKNRLLVADTQRMRIQIYNKLSSYMEPQRNL